MADDHAEDSCPLCPDEDRLAAMRARNREARREKREKMLARISVYPKAWVHAVETRNDIGPDMVVHVASTIDKAREFCLRQSPGYFSNEAQLHIVPHLVDAPKSEKHSGTVSVAVYGIRKGGSAIEDLAGTEDE